MKKEVHDSNGKLVCVVENTSKSVEIKKKNVTTIVSFKSNGDVLVKERKEK